MASVGEGSNHDDQAEKQWTKVNDKNELIAEKRGYKNKQEYLNAKRRFNRIESLIKKGNTRAQAIKEVNAIEKMEAKQLEIDIQRRKEEKERKKRQFLARYLDANNLENKIEMNLKELLANKG